MKRGDKSGGDSTTSSKPLAYDFPAMIAEARHGVFVHRHFKPLYANPAFARLLGFPDVAALLALPLIRPLVPPDNWPQQEARHAALLREKHADSTGVTRLRLLRPDGSEVWLALTERKVPWTAADGKVQDAAEWHCFDISDQMKTESQLLASEQRLRALLEVLPTPVLIARQPDGQILFVNRKACLLFGLSANALLKRRMFDAFVRPDDKEQFLAMLGSIKELRELEIAFYGAGAREFLAEIAAISIDYAGHPAVLLALNDISARKQLEAELFHQASTDALTGISNRRYFLARGEQELRRARRFGRPLCAMMLDIDHFKRVNDTHGHAAGDIVLQSMVQSAQGRLRGTDTIGRLGGEEFAVLMPETELSAATEVANRLRQSIAAQEISLGKSSLSITVSIGVAALHPEDADIDALLHRADTALYQAKQGGRNRVVGASEA